MRKLLPWAVAALALAAGALLLTKLRAPGFGRRPANLLLVSIDTLRADRLGCYGHTQAQTPYIDALAARGLRFEQATTVTPLTLPAHASLLTGTFPGHHGVRDNGGFYLGEEHRTLAEVLRERGYRTGGFVGAFVLDSRFGIHQGFDRYFDEFDLSKYDGVGMDTVQRSGDVVVAKAVEWLKQDERRPFFAWVHLYDPHAPYEAPEPHRSRFPATMAGAYDAEVAASDAFFGRLLDALASDGRLDETLVVVVGDHGESLGEHREQAHGFFVYDATVRIPLIVAGPGIPTRAVAEPVRIVDVMPTLLDRLGVAAPAEVQGKSLLPAGRGERLGLVGLSETYYPRYHYGWSELAAIRDGRYKLIAAPRRELYDLREDAGETRDLALEEPQRADILERALRAELARMAGTAAARGPQPIDPETEERLQALGYIGGTQSARHLDERARADPKDKIELYNLLKLAGSASVAGRIDEAVARVREVLAQDGEVIEGHTMLGNLHVKARRYDAAALAYRAALALDPGHQAATFSLALAYKLMERYDDALAGFERALALDARNTKAQFQLADIWMRRGRFDRAEPALRAALDRKVDRPAFLVKLGECLIEMKRYEEAERSLREALRAQPDVALAHYDLGLVLEAKGEPALAMREYEAEIARNPKAYRASFNLAKLLLAAGRPRDAAARFREAVTADPELGAGHLYLAKALLDSGDVEGARASALRGLAARPERKLLPLGHYILADVYTRLGRPKDAAREVQLARTLERGS